MKAIALLLTLLAALPMLVPAAATGDHTVDVVNNAYRDSASGNAVTRVAVGTTVTWIWLAGLHTVTDGVHGLVLAGDEFDSPLIDAEDEDNTFSHTFDSAGQWAYFCERHPTMRGVVIVE